MIQNADIFERDDLRRAALRMLEAGLEAVDTGRAVRRRVSLRDRAVSVDGASFVLGSGGLYVVSVGKCAVPAAQALEDILGDALTGGIVLGIDESAPFRTLRYFRGTHPFPSEANKTASEAVISLLEGLTKDDRVVFVISGGGSSLLYDSDKLSADEEAQMLKALFRAGANIDEINTIRKHTSRARGGNLARAAYPAESIALIFSDVPLNILQFISSGPTVKDETTLEEALGILARYHILETCDMKDCHLIETPKDEKYFETVENLLFVSNAHALEAMRREAETLGFSARVCDACVTGEARTMGRLAAEALHGAPAHSAMLYGGETTVTISGGGEGGRNQELVLGALPELHDGEFIAALASDGRDNGPHAGAVGDASTLAAAQSAGLDPDDYLVRNDSYHFFERTGDAILTGPTGINISDITVALKR